MGVVIHLDNEGAGGGNAQGSSYQGSFLDYTTLVAGVSSPKMGDIAVVETATGTAWLPWTLGGTYYPEGTYYFDGVIWDSNVKLIAEELQNINDELALLNPLLIVNKTADYTAINSDYILMRTGSTDKTVTLPIAPVKDDVVSVTKTDSAVGTVIIDANGKKMIGEDTKTIKFQYTSISLQYNGVAWTIK